MNRKNMTSRQMQAIKTKKKISDSAYDLVRKKGFDNITMHQICKKAGVSAGAIYHYFKSKNDIIFTVHDRLDAYFKETVTGHLTGAHSTEEKLKIFFYHYAYHAEYSKYDFVKHIYHTDNSFLVDKNRFINILLLQIIKTGQETGEISDEKSAESIAELLFIVSKGIIFNWCLYNGSYDIKEKMDEIMSQIISMFLKA